RTAQNLAAMGSGTEFAQNAGDMPEGEGVPGALGGLVADAPKMLLGGYAGALASGLDVAIPAAAGLIPYAGAAAADRAAQAGRAGAGPVEQIARGGAEFAANTAGLHYGGAIGQAAMAHPGQLAIDVLTGRKTLEQAWNDLKQTAPTDLVFAAGLHGMFKAIDA